MSRQDDTDNSDIYEDQPQMMECKEYPEVNVDNYIEMYQKMLKGNLGTELSSNIITLLITQGRI